jgi:photosystem II stability/assembly factor-like uncharacterized protein
MLRRRLIQGAGLAALAGPRAFAAAPRREGRLAYDWRSVPYGAGGYVDGFLFHPRERGLLYARTDIGGAYRFDEATQSWRPLLDHLSKADADLMGVLSLAIDPNDPDRLYAACGLYLDERVRSGALLASRDRGASWQVHELGVHLGGNWYGRGSGERLQVDPRDGQVLWLGTTRDGLMKSEDRGRTFRPLSFAPRHVSFVLIDPKSGDVYAGSHDQPALYVSRDGGASFVRDEATPRQVPQQAAFGPDGSLVVSFALGDAELACNPGRARNGGVWKRTPDGRWSEITPEKPQAGPGGFGYSGVDIAPSGRIVVSTIERHRRGGDEIYVSDDGGAHWTAVSSRSYHDAHGYPWLIDYMSTEHGMGHWTSALKLDPFNPERALYGTGYGVWMTCDLGADSVHWRFTVANFEETATLEIRSPARGPRLLAAVGDIAGGAWDDPARPLGDGFFKPTKETNRALDFAELAPNIIARTGDRASGGYWSDDGGASWHAFETSPRSGRSHIEALAVCARGSAFVYAPQRGAALHSQDRGRTWSPCRGWPEGDAFLRPVADRAADAVFYVHDREGGRVLASRDGGRSFAPLLEGLPRLAREAQWSHLLSAPDSRGDLWLALDDRLLHRAGNGHAPRAIDGVDAAWMLALGRGAPRAAYRHSLYLWGRVHGVEGLFRSDDAGASFVRINDDAHRYGRLLSMAGDAREHGVLYIAPHGRGIVAGRPTAA